MADEKTPAGDSNGPKFTPPANATTVKRVLVVDDDDGIRGTLETQLIKAGFKVDVAANGKHALTKLAAGAKPALIVTDLIMPVMNGHEFIKSIRANSDWKNIPVMVMTGTQDRTLLMETVAFGLSHLFIKPLNYEEAVKKITAFLSKSPDSKAGGGAAA